MELKRLSAFEALLLVEPLASLRIYQLSRAVLRDELLPQIKMIVGSGDDNHLVLNISRPLHLLSVLAGVDVLESLYKQLDEFLQNAYF